MQFFFSVFFFFLISTISEILFSVVSKILALDLIHEMLRSTGDHFRFSRIFGYQVCMDHDVLVEFTFRFFFTCMFFFVFVFYFYCV